MSFVTFYENYIINTDFINKFIYKNLKFCYKLKSITFRTNIKGNNFKKILSFLLIIELLTNKIQINYKLYLNFCSGYYVYKLILYNKIKKKNFFLKYIWLYVPKNLTKKFLNINNLNNLMLKELEKFLIIYQFFTVITVRIELNHNIEKKKVFYYFKLFKIH